MCEDRQTFHGYRILAIDGTADEYPYQSTATAILIERLTQRIYQLAKKVDAKKNVLRGRYNRAKKQLQALKCQHE